MKNRPLLSFFSIWNMCLGFFGIQFAFALQNANVSRIFQSLGAEMDTIPILWLAAPLTGLLVQPLVGYFSDNTWTRFGRRRPYFLSGAILATFALFVMPNSSFLWVAVLSLWMLDAAINLTMEPFRALIGDNLSPAQRALGFSTQSFFIGFGAVIASALPWILAEGFSVSNTSAPGELPQTVIYSFYIGGAALFFSVIWSAITSKEIPPEQRNGNIKYNRLTTGNKKYLSTQTNNYFIKSIYIDFISMPQIMKQLAIVQLFTWFALFALWIYATPAITAKHYGGNQINNVLYNEGANWVGILFASYNGIAAISAIFLPFFANKLGSIRTHSICLFCGAIGFISIFYIPTPKLILLSMFGIGIAWSSILSLPYAILANALPDNKMGVYIGIFNIFIVIPQIIAASVLGFLISSLFDNNPIYAFLIAGLSLIFAAIATLRIEKNLQQNATRFSNHQLCRQ